jgi:hypothetical protein
MRGSKEGCISFTDWRMMDCVMKRESRKASCICVCADMSDMYFPGIIWRTLGSIFVKTVAAYGRWSGEEERLLKRYWY